MASTSSSSSFFSCVTSLSSEGGVSDQIRAVDAAPRGTGGGDAADSPVSRSGAQLGVVFDFRLGAAGAHGGHAPVGEGEGDHLAGPGGGKNLGAKYDREKSCMFRLAPITEKYRWGKTEKLQI